jgi:predicted transcriptional regulator
MLRTIRRLLSFEDPRGSMISNGPDGQDARPSPKQEGEDAYSSIDALPARIRQIAVLRGLGYSFREIGKEFEVTPQAVSLMLARHRRSLRKLKVSAELANLSARAVNALGRHGIRTRREAARTNVLAQLAGERNCGAKTTEEIRRWMQEDDAACRRSGAATASASGAERPHPVGCEGGT